MGTTGTLLVGIACVLAQGSPEAEKLKEQLTKEETQLIEQLKEDKTCEQLEQYIQQGGGKDDDTIMMGCSSCLKTTTTLKKKNAEK